MNNKRLIYNSPRMAHDNRNKLLVATPTTSHQEMTRRRFLQASAIAGAAGAWTGPVALADDSASAIQTGQVRLISRPVNVFKIQDNQREQTEAWFFIIFAEIEKNQSITPVGMEVVYFVGSTEVKREHYSKEGLGSVTVHGYPPPHMPNGDPPPRPVWWPFGIRIRCREPISLQVDKVRIQLTVADTNGNQDQSEIEVAASYYKQKTELIFPFKGPGVITNAGVANGGHRNRSGQFALDALVTNRYTALLNNTQDTLNSSFVGWNAPILAPADGVIVFARSDRPNQPNAQSEDASYFAPEFPQGGDPGNHVIIDHGNREFSMMAHFQPHSILARIGDRVRQGQLLARLGSSGDTTAPHVHYQLQDGPKWLYADALPCTFKNIKDSEQLNRGEFFEAV
jgi:hypothetical protein